MASRCIAALAATLILSGAAAHAAAAEPVKPRAGISLTGRVQFPRGQTMTIQTGRSDSSRLTVAMGFDGRCRGGGLGELFASNVRTASLIRARDGRISATLTGRLRRLGGVEGRTGVFTWRLTGRFVKRDVVRATVTGSAEVRKDGRTISRCKIAKPARARLTRRSA
jgi:hypothetical protein